VLDGRPAWRVPAAAAAARRPSLADRLDPLPSELPRVDLIAQHVDIDAGIVAWLLGRGARGLVLAGTGHGTLSMPMQEALAQAAAAGCLIVRSSRVASGPVLRDAGVDDGARGFVAAGFVPPHKARLIAALALATGMDRAATQALFDRF
jgi:L-asparaginase